MADMPITDLPVKTAPATGDKFLGIGTAEEYIIDYDKLADAVLGKLTSKTYALDQGTKSLVAALNELNSKTSFKTGVTDKFDTNNPDTIFATFAFDKLRTFNLSESIRAKLRYSWVHVISLMRDSETGTQFITSLFCTVDDDRAIYKRQRASSTWSDWYNIFTGEKVV